jgi:LytS/YehU family sensor histidine kinase
VEPAARKPFRSTAVGLENLSRRLRLLYPGAHSLEISAAEGWVVARVILRNVAAASGPAVNFASGT